MHMTEGQGSVVVEREGLVAMFDLSPVEGVRKTDLDAIREVWDEDVYHLDGLDLTGQMAIDLGAHIGAFAVRVALKGAQVLAVEPSPTNVERLRAHIAANNLERVAVRAMACGANSDDVGLAEMEGTGMLARNDGSAVKFPCVTLIDLVAGVTIPGGSVLKIDTEGSEMAILEGASDLLGEFDRIEIETHPMTRADAGLIIESLLWTHNVNWFGAIARGGMISARRY